ncbi:DUF4248 domain-containing protein [Bacteroides sp. 51]|uniref:DUF4248 domain-containing protein n=1 Tax=Bacteroides sp. 51 TaxID=2302938 RepID=UPI0013D8CA62|nr:DUF4248 domain-containing protein [Bacteroides sp. 51]NDV84255.1 DUF4248 domain-containing protein [Bacteroides sp. 51]
MKEQIIDQAFVYKGYKKTELATMYNPHMTQKKAMETFNKWLRSNPEFWLRLQTSGVVIGTQYYRKSQVEIIVSHLGEP